jgi:preprotein translocase subunit SecA
MTPSQEYRRTFVQTPRKLTEGLDARVHGMVGSWKRRERMLTRLLEDAQEVDGLSPVYAPLSDRQLRDRLDTFRDLTRRYRKLDPRVVQHALAAVREAAERRLGLKPFVVQLAGALALHRGYLAEMATGEGKTLTAGLAVVLAAWSREPCHVITVNDYLARRDSEWMKPLYLFCGVKAGHIAGGMEPRDRWQAYQQDVTYCTGKEIVADRLRDRLRLGRFQDATRREIRFMLQPRQRDRMGLVLRGLHTAIVDEADSVLIDEAVTPVIISSMNANRPLKEACRRAGDIAEELEEGVHYKANLRYKEIEILDEGEDRVEELCEKLPGLWRGPARRLELVRQALNARVYFLNGKQYVIQDGKAVIVDEFTGRIMPQRTWREGLHQAIEAKEGIEVTDPTETLARLSFQRFYRFFTRLSGMTGTGLEAADEFWHIYKLPVASIPTNEPCIREHHPDRVFPDLASKWDAVIEEVVRLHGEGRPVLVGTRSVTVSEELSNRLNVLALDHRVLNAVRHKEEAQIVAEAGQPGHITIATNMAGRGTDIILGKGVRELGGLHVLATERHESGRIDRQLFGRSGRQGDPGSAQAFVSAEDELLERFSNARLRENLARAARDPGAAAQEMARFVFTRAQHSAQRLASRQRKNVLKMDTWMEDALSFAGPE